MDNTKESTLSQESWAIWKRICLPIGLMTLVTYLPLLIGEYLLTNAAMTQAMSYFVISSAVALFIVGTILASSTAFAAAAQLATGRELLWSATWDAVKRYSVRSVLLIVLSTLVIALGMVALIIPGIIIMLDYSLVMPVLFCEGLRPRQCMQRSSELVKGARAKFFLYWVTLTGINLLLIGAVKLLAWLALGQLAQPSALFSLEDVFTTVALSAIAPAFYTALYQRRVKGLPSTALTFEAEPISV